MNTIQINTADGTVNYTESEVLRFIERAKEVDAVQQVSDEYRAKVTAIRHEVRDFFSEGEWRDGETNVNKGDVNMLLESIGCNKLTSRYGGTFTITGTFQVEAEDEDEAANKFVESVDVNFYDGDITIDDTTTDDVSEDY